MKKILLIILTLGYFVSAQAKPHGPSYRYSHIDTHHYWIPAATVITIAGLIELHSQNERRDYEDGIRETVYLIEESESIEGLSRVKATHSRYFTESVQTLYRERKRSLSRDRNYSPKQGKGEQLTIFLINDTDTIGELEEIKEERLRYFTEEVQDEYFARKKELKWKK